MKDDLEKMKKDYELARERERQRLLRLRKVTEEAHILLIKKLRLKKGYKYILFFPKSAGLCGQDLGKLDYKLVDLTFLVEDTKGIKVIEYDGKISKVLNLRKEKRSKD